MASSSSRGHDGRTTRLQDLVQKRRVEEELKENEEIKRQKDMFAPKNIIEPRDIPVNSKPSMVKVEEDPEYCSSVKHEIFEVESSSIDEPNNSFGSYNLPNIKMEDETSLVVKVEETLDMPEFLVTEQQFECENFADEAYTEHEVIPIEKEYSSTDFSKLVSQPEPNKLTQNHLKSLKILIDLKDQEIGVLRESLRELELQLETSRNSILNPNPESAKIPAGDFPPNNERIILSSDTGDWSQIVVKLTYNLKEKDEIIRNLSRKLFKLQNETFPQLLQLPFEKVLPLLYPELQLNEILACRKVCHYWSTAVDTFLSSNPSAMLFDKDTRLRDEKNLKLPIPVRTESPLHNLALAYKFSDFTNLNNFTKERKGKIIGSVVWLDNISIDSKTSEDMLKAFLSTFGIHIKYLKLCQGFPFDERKIRMFMARIKLCLDHLPNLAKFTLVYRLERSSKNGEDNSNRATAMNRMSHKNWHFGTFPKLAHLESIAFEVKNNFLESFLESLIQPYCNQLKQLSILTRGIGSKKCIGLQNLVQLTIRQEFLEKVEFECKNLQKCTLIWGRHCLKETDVVRINNFFPKLVCIRFIFENENIVFGAESTEFKTPPSLPAILILELENCRALSYYLLKCFPNLRYLKLINELRDELNNLDTNHYTIVLAIDELCKGRHFYKNELFWRNFRSISSVTFELSGDLLINPGTKICKWTREEYIQYSSLRKNNKRKHSQKQTG